MLTFNIADRVVVSLYGLGTVDWLGDEYIGVVFDHVGKALVRRDRPDLRFATEEDEKLLFENPESEGDAGEDEPIGPFIVFEEGGDDPHSMDSHWAPFFDDAMVVVEHLPELLRSARPNQGCVQVAASEPRVEFAGENGVLLAASTELVAECLKFSRPSHRWDDSIPWKSPGGALVETRERAQAWSERETGIAIVVALSTASGEPNQFRSMFPYCMNGVSYDIELKRVFVWAGGVEAQLEARIGSAVITFYDAEFVANRGWYRPDRKYQFLLTAIAYDAGPADVKTFTIPRTIEHFEGMHWLTGEDRRSDSDALEETYSTEGLVYLLPVSGWDVDDYEFNGQIEDIWGMSMLGQRAWRLRTVVMRDSLADVADENIRLDIVVTERIWKGDNPPQVGQTIAGHLWLQGHLSSAPRRR